MRTWLRRIALLYLIVLAVAFFEGLFAAAANAAEPGTVDGWFATVPAPLIAGVLLANLIPYLSAVLTREAGWWTGIATMALSFLDGLLSEITHSGTPVHWRLVLGTALSAWAIAAAHHRFVSANVELVLHSKVGNVPRAKLLPPANP